MTRFIGRREELEDLKSLLKKRSSSLVVIRGRRRIGKSRLAEEFGHSFKNVYMLSGVPPEPGVTAQDQRNEFARQMRRLGILITNALDWGDLLADLAAHCTKGQILVVLDEITWMGDQDSTFLPKLKTIWDLHFKSNPQLVLLISGSNSTWIEANILSSTGFFGRISHQLRLEELPLNQCSEFWSGSIDPFEKFKILSITGGVPLYLEEIRSDWSAEQNIFALCYKKNGILVHEFDRIFSDLFAKRNLIYKTIMHNLVNQRAMRQELIEMTGLSKGGRLSEYLEDLAEAGFLTRDDNWNIGKEQNERLGHYRICDNYMRYFLRYIEPHKDRILKGKIKSLPSGWKSVLGLQFENLVCNNGLLLIDVLGLNSDDVIWCGPYVQSTTTRRKGCQIDYLIQTRHRVLYLCEVKFSDNIVPYSVISEMQEKSRRLQIPRGYSCRHVLIHVNGVSERIEYDEFFSSIVNFGQFLEQPT